KKKEKEEEYIIDKIVAHMKWAKIVASSWLAYDEDEFKKSKCPYGFRVKWVGFSDEEDTWQTYESFYDQSLPKEYGRKNGIELFPETKPRAKFYLARQLGKGKAFEAQSEHSQEEEEPVAKKKKSKKVAEEGNNDEVDWSPPIEQPGENEINDVMLPDLPMEVLMEDGRDGVPRVKANCGERIFTAYPSKKRKREEEEKKRLRMERGEENEDEEEWKFDKIMGHVEIEDVVDGRRIEGKDNLNLATLNNSEYSMMYKALFTVNKYEGRYKWLTAEEIRSEKILVDLERHCDEKGIPMPECCQELLAGINDRRDEEAGLFFD
ncbi:hypothetical protein PFISCL1PPCAC_1041, partial [Pristionchus fissidentatus]